MRRFITVAVVATTIALTGCKTTSEREMLYGAAGAAAGGLLGSQIGGGTGNLIAIGAGVAIGGLLGQQIGREFDNNDVRTTGHVLETQPTGSRNQWNNPDTGATYAVTPTRTFQPVPNGKYCREFILEDATVAGSNQQVYGTACRQPDGTWEMVNR